MPKRASDPHLVAYNMVVESAAWPMAYSMTCSLQHDIRPAAWTMGLHTGKAIEFGVNLDFKNPLKMVSHVVSQVLFRCVDR